MSYSKSTLFASPVGDNERAYDALGNRIAARLNEGLDEVHSDILQRLRFAREQAVSKSAALGRTAPAKGTGVRGYIAVPAYAGQSGTGNGGDGDEKWHWAARMLSLLLMLAFFSALVGIEQHAKMVRASEVAEVDIQILTDDLPPYAYMDPGFMQYLRGKGN